MYLLVTTVKPELGCESVFKQRLPCGRSLRTAVPLQKGHSFYMNKAIASLSSLTSIANMADHKKEEIFEYERKQSERSVPDSNDDILNLFTEEEKKKLMWRIDVRLCLTLGLMYCVSLMDRYLHISPNITSTQLTSDNTAPTWALLW